LLLTAVLKGDKDMPKLRLWITMSLDGFVAGPSQSLDNPLGIGGERLHDWAFELETAGPSRRRTGRAPDHFPPRARLADPEAEARKCFAPCG